MATPVKLAVVHYSATGTITEIVKELRDAGVKAGAGVRLLKVAELAPQAAVDSNPAWAANHAATADIPEASAPPLASATSPPSSSSSSTPSAASGPRASWPTRSPAASSPAPPPTPARSRPCRPSTAPSTTSAAKFTDGNPYGTSHVDAQGNNPVDDTARAAARIQAERAVKIAASLKAAA